LVVLVEHGIPSQNLSTAFSTSVNLTDISAEILRAAREWDCATVVTGRHDLPWMQEILHRHVGDQVVKSGKDMAVTVVPS
jgi:K+-sensing histidine kinase KdpD